LDYRAVVVLRFPSKEKKKEVVLAATYCPFLLEVGDAKKRKKE